MDIQTLSSISEITFFFTASVFLILLIIFIIILIYSFLALAIFLKNLPTEIKLKIEKCKQFFKENFTFSQIMYNFFKNLHKNKEKDKT